MSERRIQGLINSTYTYKLGGGGGGGGGREGGLCKIRAFLTRIVIVNELMTSPLEMKPI